MGTLLNFWLSFLAGLSAPIFAVCVLPLYPGYLSLLSSKLSTNATKKTYVLIGFIVTLGVIISMFLFGLIFTFFLQKSLTKAIGIISPLAFGILALISILMIFNFDLGRIFPKFNSPIRQNPLWDAFLFGFFFGAIVLPCNPASLAVLFAISTSTVNFLNNLINFLLFGIGMGMPLLLFSILSANNSQAIINWLGLHKRKINLIAGLIMLGISSYYLFFVFKIIG